LRFPIAAFITYDLAVLAVVWGMVRFAWFAGAIGKTFVAILTALAS
jgi:hypothetical protein